MKTDKGSFWIASRLGLSHGIDQWILMEDLNMWHISTKSVPWLLTYKQKQWCVFVCQEDEVKNYQNFLQRPKQETKSVFTHKTQKPPLSGKACPLHIQRKWSKPVDHQQHVLFWLCTVHQEFVPPCHMVNQHCYWEVLQKEGASPWKHPEWWQNQDKVLTHLALSIKIFGR